MWKDFIRFGDLLEPGREKKKKRGKHKGNENHGRLKWFGVESLALHNLYNI